MKLTPEDAISYYNQWWSFGGRILWADDKAVMYIDPLFGLIDLDKFR